MTRKRTPFQKRSCDGKTRYKDHDQAVRHAQIFKSLRGTALRAYECDFCKGVHLSKTQVSSRRAEEGPEENP